MCSARVRSLRSEIETWPRDASGVCTLVFNTCQPLCFVCNWLLLCTNHYGRRPSTKECGRSHHILICLQIPTLKRCLATTARALMGFLCGFEEETHCFKCFMSEYCKSNQCEGVEVGAAACPGSQGFCPYSRSRYNVHAEGKLVRASCSIILSFGSGAV